MSTMPQSKTPSGYGRRGGILRVSNLMGSDVSSREGESLGSIDDIMVDSQSGEIRYAVLSAGGFLGVGERFFAIPWQALHLDETEHGFLLDVDADRLKDAPGFDKHSWPDMADPTWVDSVGSYYSSSADSSGDTRGSEPSTKT